MEHETRVARRSDERLAQEAETGGALVGGTPAGMDAADVADRAELARWIGKEVWPAERDDLLLRAAALKAPENVIDILRRLPGDELYTNLADVWETLGRPLEQRRF